MAAKEKEDHFACGASGRIWSVQSLFFPPLADCHSACCENPSRQSPRLDNTPWRRQQWPHVLQKVNNVHKLLALSVNFNNSAQNCHMEVGTYHPRSQPHLALLLQNPETQSQICSRHWPCQDPTQLSAMSPTRKPKLGWWYGAVSELWTWII